MKLVLKLWNVIWVRGLGKLFALLLILPIKLYQVTFSPMLGEVCRYYPSCSKYAVGALHTHGPVKGLLLTSYRLVRCTPLTKGGLDPVPDRGNWQPNIFPDGSPRLSAKETE
jgi:putative membrane protein insertion efficiency factor